jgi:hypothetical protein
MEGQPLARRRDRGWSRSRPLGVSQVYREISRRIIPPHVALDLQKPPRYILLTRERRMVQPMKIDSNSCTTVREVTEA